MNGKQARGPNTSRSFSTICSGDLPKSHYLALFSSILFLWLIHQAPFARIVAAMAQPAIAAGSVPAFVAAVAATAAGSWVTVADTAASVVRLGLTFSFTKDRSLLLRRDAFPTYRILYPVLLQN